MKGWKKGVLVAGAVASISSGALWMFEPGKPGTEKATQQEIERQLDMLQDADEASKDRMRDRGMDGVDMENSQKLVPHEPRPRPPVPKGLLK